MHNCQHQAAQTINYSHLMKNALSTIHKYTDRSVPMSLLQGIEMPSRSRLTADMKKHGEVRDVQQVSQQQTFLFIFASEEAASAAHAALQDRAHLVWKLPEVGPNTFDGLQSQGQFW